MRRFLIVGTFRTGSSALAEQLGLHPHIACGWESAGRHYFGRRVNVMAHVLNADFRDVRRAEREFYQRNGAITASALGFRLLFRAHHRWRLAPQLSLLSVAEALEPCLKWLNANRDVHVIHLVRRDNLHWLRSVELARISGEYAGVPYPSELCARIPIDAALRRVRMKQHIGSRCATLADTQPYACVTYEDFRARPAQSIERLWRFLGVQPTPQVLQQATLHKQSSTGNAIINRQELSDALIEANLAQDSTGL